MALDKDRHLCSAFRKGIEIAKARGEYSCDAMFINFPVGCCGEASRMLSLYLLEQGIRSRYVSARYFDSEIGGFSPHAWLILEQDCIADITGDQFRFSRALGGYSERCYVGPADYFHSEIMRDFDVEDWLYSRPEWADCPLFSTRYATTIKYVNYILEVEHYGSDVVI